MKTKYVTYLKVVIDRHTDVVFVVWQLLGHGLFEPECIETMDEAVGGNDGQL